jgi:CheY-like chemotaxis protein
MSSVLLIYDDRNASLTVPAVLAQMNIAPVRLVLEEFHPEFLFSEIFELIVFELFGEIGSCIAVLEQLERWVTTSGLEAPPVIAVTEDGNDRIEQALRTAKVNFFFVKPVAEEELIVAIKQCLLLPKA